MSDPDPSLSDRHPADQPPADLRPPVADASDPRPVAPEPPLPGDCCDSGCDPCVHDLYADELTLYRERLARWRERHPGAE